MEPNIPQHKAATKPAPSPAAMPPRKPPKLYTRLRMTSIKAPQATGQPGKQDSAPTAPGKRRLAGWVIGFLILTVLALSFVIKTTQDKAQNEKARISKAAAEQKEQKGKLIALTEAVEKERAALKTRVAEMEKEGAISAQLQEDVAKARKLRTEAEAALQQATGTKTATEQDMATLKASLEQASQKTVAVQEQTKPINVLRDEIATEKQRKEFLLRDAAKAAKDAQAAEKERAKLETKVKKQAEEQAKEQSKRMPEDMKQREAADKIQAELDSEKQARAETEAIIAEANKTRAETEQAVAELKKKLVEGKKRGNLLEQREKELVKERKLSAEAEKVRQQAMFDKTLAEQDMATIMARLEEASEKVTPREQAEEQAKEQSKRMPENMKQREAADKIRAELDGEKQARAETEQAVAELKQKLVEGEKRGNLLEQREKELAKERKLSAEAEKVRQQAMFDKTLAEQDMATIKARLEKASEKVTAREQAEAQALQDEILKEKQRKESLLRDAARARVAIQAAEKEQAYLQAQAAKTPPVKQFNPDQGKPESAAATEKRIVPRARVEPPSGAIESAQKADTAKTTGGFLTAGSEANRHYKTGIKKWYAGDVDGAISEFKKTIDLDSSAAAACHNIALGYVEKGDRNKACEYAYQAGEMYIKNNDNTQATRVVAFIRTIDPSSSLSDKLSRKIARK